MLTIFDERFNIDRKKLFPLQGIKYRELLDFIDFYQLTSRGEFLDTIFEYYVAKDNDSNQLMEGPDYGVYNRLRAVADDLDSGKIIYKFYEPANYPLPSLSDLSSNIPLLNLSPAPFVSRPNTINRIIDRLIDPVMLSMLCITTSSVLYTYFRK